MKEMVLERVCQAEEHVKAQAPEEHGAKSDLQEIWCG